ncbi:hypothetical protein FUT84_11760 [Treponema phagedenis]|uniref:Uncharacterized protein n=1 Tax=Treponema phagedenis TaxID=162 RepID=A0A0B7GQI4_TREPH|nr:hypothetical protein FUT79_12845 [Treponema phagedenis]QEJ98959.1 hypothetical protein FUT82_13815 [Treponema phagedenis]QEK01761.1 hypothetical protein FUT84_11760 [Treponema phagedenis]QEK04467.1 hypothetical protein FUT83_12115 [Treponema phagedenis]QEK06876.1 hypothetical protein FUT80_09250 [Treponema phagedenis]
MLNSKRCFKASTQNGKIEALKLVGEVRVNFQNFALAPCLAHFYNRKLITKRYTRLFFNITFCGKRQSE